MAAAAAFAPSGGLPIAGRVAFALVIATWSIWSRAAFRHLTAFGRGLPGPVRFIIAGIVLAAICVEALLLAPIVLDQ